MKNCYQLLLHHHHAKGATCAFQFLTAAIVDNPKRERGEGRDYRHTMASKNSEERKKGEQNTLALLYTKSKGNKAVYR